MLRFLVDQPRRDGLISRRIFADAGIFEIEKEQIFGRAWFFLGHESEIPEPGDLVGLLLGIAAPNLRQVWRVPVRPVRHSAYQ